MGTTKAAPLTYAPTSRTPRPAKDIITKEKKPTYRQIGSVKQIIIQGRATCSLVKPTLRKGLGKNLGKAGPQATKASSHNGKNLSDVLKSHPKPKHSRVFVDPGHLVYPHYYGQAR